ncbi:MAG: Tautomerase enzyme [Pseudomonadota bacterium]
MPITLTVSEGLLPAEAEAEVFAALSDALLNVAGLRGNTFMTPNVVGSINVLPKQHLFAGGKAGPAAFIELKLPGIALATDEARQAFIAQATDIVERAAAGKLPRERIWTNVVYAADGAWGIGGKAYSNDDLIGAVQRAAVS